MSASNAGSVQLAFFGKLPSRGDFVRSQLGGALIANMDRWISAAMERLAQDAHWKSAYDQAAPLHFAFLGVGRGAGQALAGHLCPSVDQSGRRFPMVTMGCFEVPACAAFAQRAPMALNKLNLKLQHAVQGARSDVDPSAALADFAEWQITIDTDPAAYEASYRDFLEMHTLGSLQSLLTLAGHHIDLRQSLLALGLLLEAIPSSGQDCIDTGLCLPLPGDAMFHPHVATLWLDLVSRFFSRSDIEMLVLMPQSTPGIAPTLCLGFAGGDTDHLAAMLDSRLHADAFVDVRQAAWVEVHLPPDYNAKKLSSYLQQPQLSLLQATRTFREVFLGE